MPINIFRKDHSMQRAIDDLSDILEKQIENYETLKGLMLEKRKAIISNNLRELADVTLRIESRIASNNELEIRRIEFVKKIAEKMGLPEPRPTLAQIADGLDGLHSLRLLDLRRRAADAIRDVQRQNRINAEMLKYSAELIDSVLRSMVEAGSFEPTYGRTGKTTSKTASVSLLDKEI